MSFVPEVSGEEMLHTQTRTQRGRERLFNTIWMCDDLSAITVGPIFYLLLPVNCMSCGTTSYFGRKTDVELQFILMGILQDVPPF